MAAIWSLEGVDRTLRKERNYLRAREKEHCKQDKEMKDNLKKKYLAHYEYKLTI